MTSAYIKEVKFLGQSLLELIFRFMKPPHNAGINITIILIYEKQHDFNIKIYA